MSALRDAPCQQPSSAAIIHSIVNMFTVPFRSSSCIEKLEVNPFFGVVKCTFKDGYTYEYDNVSKRAILNLLFNPNMSLGFWVNTNLVNTSRTDYACVDFSV